MQNYDAIIIGAGQAGGPLAHRLADRDWKVALIEREHLGGTCINYGCTPTKAMIASARAAYQARTAEKLGVQTGEIRVDLPRIVERKNKLVKQWRQGQQEHADKRSTLQLYRGTGHFTGSHTVQVNEQELAAEKIFINTGSRSLLLPIEGLDQTDYLTNRSILDLTEIPEHLIIIGASYIGLEFGQMFRRFGAKVSIIEMMDQITPMEDGDVAEVLQAILEEEGIEFRLGSQASAVRQTENKAIEVSITGKDKRDEKLVGSHLLLAAGRAPNTDSLNLEAAGVETEKGWIKVNPKLETNVEGVYALGDVTGGPAFTHISYNDFQIVYHNLFHEKEQTTEGRIVPYAMFTDPELGRVGMTEKAAENAGYNTKVGTIPLTWVARAIKRADTRGLMKIVVDADTDKILGAAMLSSHGGELVQTVMALIMADAPWTTFKEAVFIHPTMTEGFFTLMDNVE